MQGIVDRLLVLICCSALLPGRVDDIAAVVAVLAAMTVNALNGYVKSPRISRGEHSLLHCGWHGLAEPLPLSPSGVL